jgi:hypothetical protein
MLMRHDRQTTEQRRARRRYRRGADVLGADMLSVDTLGLKRDHRPQIR